ncbi:MAG: FGGY family carbohydrate kinase [Pseudomonadota bacterium]
MTIPVPDNAVIAIDVGSSALKAVLFSAAGEVLARQVKPYPTSAPSEGAAEQQPDDWWRALIDAVVPLAAEAKVHALVLTGSMQNLILADEGGNALAPAMLYSDARVTTDLRRAWQADLPLGFDQQIGNHPDNAQCIYKIRWYQTRWPDLADKTSAFHFGAKDMVVHRLTGVAVTDATTATTTGLMDLASRQWLPDVMAAVNIEEDRLPRILPADQIAGQLSDPAAKALGLPSGLPVLTGTGDAAAATWGAHADEHGRPYAYLGTTGWVAAVMTMREAAPPRQTYTLAAPVGDDVIVVSPFLTAGTALEWIARITGQEVPEAIEAAKGADGEPPAGLFLPYLMGERAPFEDRDVRAAMFGLDTGCDGGSLAYAVMEGLAHAVRHNLESLPVAWRDMTAIGGAAESDIQRQLLADVTGLQIAAPPLPRMATAYGAWRIAARALGLGDGTLDATRTKNRRPERAERAEARYRSYLSAVELARELAPSLTIQPGNAARDRLA